MLYLSKRVNMEWLWEWCRCLPLVFRSSDCFAWFSSSEGSDSEMNALISGLCRWMFSKDCRNAIVEEYLHYTWFNGKVSGYCVFVIYKFWYSRSAQCSRQHWSVEKRREGVGMFFDGGDALGFKLPLQFIESGIVSIC